MLSKLPKWLMPGALAITLFYAAPTCAQEASTVDIGAATVQFVSGRLNQRVAGGSSSHLATEALRVAGGEFVPEELGADSPAEGDRVWGTLVTAISRTNEVLVDSAPSSACQVGDIIQFRSAAFGSTPCPEHFTAIVAAVNGNGRPTQMYYQGWSGNRKVQIAAINVEMLSAGWMRIYRPIARIDRPDEWKFTVVNNDSVDQTYEVLVGIDSEGVVQTTLADTRNSFRVHWVKTDGTVPNILSSAGGSYFMETTKGYEIHNSPDGVGIRQLEQ